MNMTDLRFVMRVLGLGVATGLAWQPAQAGDKPAAIQAHHPGAAIHRVVFVALARSNLTPLEAQARSQVQLGNEGKKTGVDQPKEQRPTAPSERKTVRFFRLDPRLGDVSVQPVVGSVNGAQLSVGF